MDRPAARHVLPEFSERTGTGVHATDPYCLGRADSTAAVLLAAGTPGKRMVLPHARVLVRQPSFDGPVQGQASDLALQAQELLRTRESLTGMLSRYTGRSAERIRQDTERDTVLDARAAVAYGFADRLVANRTAQGAAHGAW
ncbi:ATP-dependent Clp protease proteolytic subunit [Streptomyces cinnamoneus]|uniref:ClpP family protease n=1 Tax=Streptomyces cinnamoneus TaxID=53446 RepID=UPI0034336BA3